jgi:valyl-tRNA synthetase
LQNGFAKGIGIKPGIIPVTADLTEERNTVITYGDKYILKLFRRLESGTHPALESAHAVAGNAEVFVHLDGVVDLSAERGRLVKEIERADKEIAFIEGKLARPEFVERAPAEIVGRERVRLTEQRRIHDTLSASLAALLER